MTPAAALLSRVCLPSLLQQGGPAVWQKSTPWLHSPSLLGRGHTEAASLAWYRPKYLPRHRQNPSMAVQRQMLRCKSSRAWEPPCIPPATRMPSTGGRWQVRCSQRQALHLGQLSAPSRTGASQAKAKRSNVTRSCLLTLPAAGLTNRSANLLLCSHLQRCQAWPASTAHSCCTSLARPGN